MSLFPPIALLMSYFHGLDKRDHFLMNWFGTNPYETPSKVAPFFCLQIYIKTRYTAQIMLYYCIGPIIAFKFLVIGLILQNNHLELS